MLQEYSIWMGRSRSLEGLKEDQQLHSVLDPKWSPRNLVEYEEYKRQKWNFFEVIYPRRRYCTNRHIFITTIVSHCTRYLLVCCVPQFLHTSLCCQQDKHLDFSHIKFCFILFKTCILTKTHLKRNLSKWMVKTTFILPPSNSQGKHIICNKITYGFYEIPSKYNHWEGITH